MPAHSYLSSGHPRGEQMDSAGTVHPLPPWGSHLPCLFLVSEQFLSRAFGLKVFP